MPSLIRRKLIQAQLEALPQPGMYEAVCPLCERRIPAAQQDEHHLTPKSRGGRETVPLHRICHRQIHALFTEAELARQYATVDALKSHAAMRQFLQWVRTKPEGFFERTRKSHRLKKL